MVWCQNCGFDVEVEADESNGFSCCVHCGRLIEDVAFASDVQFQKDADGGHVVGQFVGENGDGGSIARYSGGRLWAGQSGGQEPSAARGRMEIAALVEHFHIGPTNEMIEAAHRLYKLALQRGFTRGRRVNQVAAACLYIVCRQDKKPYMLIDFSDHLSMNVFALGAVFLQLIKLFRLEDYPAFVKPIDPSLYLHRFADRLRFGDKTSTVSATALKLVQCMKRDWMQTGRRPSGICGAALFISAHMHGFERTKQDIISVVHIGWSTVERRVKEFANTMTGDLTIKEFEKQAKMIDQSQAEDVMRHEILALEAGPSSTALVLGSQARRARAQAAAAADAHAVVPADEDADERLGPASPNDHSGGPTSCEHVMQGAPLFLQGMCKQCFVDYLVVSGGNFNGSYDPPAFIYNMRQEIRQQVLEEEEILDGDPFEAPQGPNLDELEMDEALRCAELAPIAKALGTDQPSSATPAAAPALAAKQGASSSPQQQAQQQRQRRQQQQQQLGQQQGQQQSQQEAAAAAAAAAAASGQHHDAATACKRAAAHADATSAEETAGRQQRQQQEAAGPASDTPATAAGSGSSIQMPADNPHAAGGDAPQPTTGAATTSQDGEVENPDAQALVLVPEEVDTLSDVDDGDIDTYLASKEEAQLKEVLWKEMNKDWLEKQAAKELAMAAAAATSKPKEKGKRAYVRRQKPVLPADNAEGAARNMLEAKKLSNKINYNVLANLFSSENTDEQGLPQTSQNQGGLSRSDFQGVGSCSGDVGNPSVGDTQRQAHVATALRKRATQRMEEDEQVASKYSRLAAEEEARRRDRGDGDGASSGPSLGGGFLESLTFVRNKGVTKGRLRPDRLAI